MLKITSARPDRVYATGVIQPRSRGVTSRPDRVYATGVIQPPRRSAAARPDRVSKTGVIQPFPFNLRPDARVRQTIAAFTTPRSPRPNVTTKFVPALAPDARQTISAFVQPVRPLGPMVSSEPQPAEVAMMVNRIATAMAAGKTFRKTVDSRLIRAAQYMIEGKPFVIKSAGRKALIRPSSNGPTSYVVR